MSARSGPSHPLCLAAVAVLVVNDHALKAAFPSPITGKLSDFAWMVVAPVVITAACARLGASDARSRKLGLAVAAVSFAALQLWPPLGEAWCAVMGGSHVADPTDLIALPALFLAPVCWRRATPRRWALPVAALACAATTSLGPSRFPCDEEPAWDPGAPLMVSWGHSPGFSTQSENFVRGVWLEEEGGRRIELEILRPSRDIVLCPRGGLRPSTTYRWRVGPFANDVAHHTPVPRLSYDGVWTFVTAERATVDAPCAAAAERADWSEWGTCTFGPTAEATGDTGP